jgi:hypothetical protein
MPPPDVTVPPVLMDVGLPPVTSAPPALVAPPLALPSLVDVEEQAPRTRAAAAAKRIERRANGVILKLLSWNKRASTAPIDVLEGRELA